MTSPLRHTLLAARGVPHGFGVIGSPPPPGCVRPRQVHGSTVARVARPAAGAGAGARAAEPAQADAIVALRPDPPVGVATADCVPVLAADADGTAVAAIHAGWRGLAAGVVDAAVAALRSSAGSGIAAVIGPHIGPCCYEVDAPVVDALRARFGAPLDAALAPSPGRPGHHMLDLGELVRRELARAGVEPDFIGVLPDACTRCDPRRFHSYRRDGALAGRMLHHIAPRALDIPGCGA